MVENSDHYDDTAAPTTPGRTCGVLSPGPVRGGRRVRCSRPAGHTDLHHFATTGVRSYWSHGANADGHDEPVSARAEAERRRQAVVGLARLDTTLRRLRTVTVATGTLMAARRLDVDDAAAALRAASLRQRRALHEVAADVIRTGDLPD